MGPQYAQRRAAGAAGLAKIPVVIAGLVVVVVLVVVLVVVTGSDDDPTATGDGEEESVGNRAARGLMVDTFPEDGGTPLETTDSGHGWYVVSGDWKVNDSAASVTPPDGMGAAVIVVDPRQDNGTFTVTLSRVTSGAGIVFRYAGPRNFWYVSAAPQAATWRVVQVVDGVEIEVETLGVVPVGDGTTIGVVLEEGEVTIVVNGEPRSTIEDESLESGSRVGLIARGPGGSDARWSHVVFVGSTLTAPTTTAPAADADGDVDDRIDENIDFPDLPGTTTTAGR
jgi:hypothetical protein